MANKFIIAAGVASALLSTSAFAQSKARPGLSIDALAATVWVEEFDVSPDAGLIAYKSAKKGTYDLWTADTKTGETKQLTNWPGREMAPVFSQRFRVALMDLAGCGAADRAAYDPPRYATLQGHAQDLEAVARTLRPGRVVLVVHSVAAMVGLLADLNAPDLFDAHVMVAPSPCYLNLPGYRGGFDLPDLQASLNLMDVNLPVWVNAMAPGLMGGPHGDPLTQEIGRASCRERVLRLV